MNTGNATFFVIVGGLALCIYFAQFMGAAHNDSKVDMKDQNKQLLNVILGVVVLLAIVSSQGLDTSGLLSGFTQAVGSAVPSSPQGQQQYVVPEGYQLVPVQPQGQNNNIPALPAPAQSIESNGTG